MSVPKVYISNARTEVEWTSSFALAIEKRGIEVWFDLWSLPGALSAQEWMDQTDRAFRGADLIITVLPLNGPLDPAILFDMGFARQMRKPIIWIRSMSTAAPRLPADLARVLSIDRSTPEQTAEVVCSMIARQLTAIGRPA